MLELVRSSVVSRMSSYFRGPHGVAGIYRQDIGWFAIPDKQFQTYPATWHEANADTRTVMNGTVTLVKLPTVLFHGATPRWRGYESNTCSSCTLVGHGWNSPDPLRSKRGRVGKSAHRDTNQCALGIISIVVVQSCAHVL